MKAHVVGVGLRERIPKAFFFIFYLKSDVFVRELENKENANVTLGTKKARESDSKKIKGPE